MLDSPAAGPDRAKRRVGEGSTGVRAGRRIHVNRSGAVITCGPAGLCGVVVPLLRPARSRGRLARAGRCAGSWRWSWRWSVRRSWRRRVGGAAVLVRQRSSPVRSSPRAGRAERMSASEPAVRPGVRPERSGSGRRCGRGRRSGPVRSGSRRGGGRGAAGRPTGSARWHRWPGPPAGLVAADARAERRVVLAYRDGAPGNAGTLPVEGELPSFEAWLSPGPVRRVLLAVNRCLMGRVTAERALAAGRRRAWHAALSRRRRLRSARSRGCPGRIPEAGELRFGCAVIR